MRRTVLAVASVVGLVLVRGARSGVQPYGSDGAQYIEHFERLRILAMVRGGGNPLGWIVEADGTYPPLLHLITLGLGAIVGHGQAAVVAQGAIWLVLLGTAVGSVCRQLGGRSDVALLAALLTPAFHGAATRYYYDLPMVALLWGAVALAFGAGGRPGRAAGVGVLAAAAAVVKWAAIPFGAPLVAGALWSAGGTRRERATALAIATAVGGGLCLAFLAGSGEDNSFGTLSQSTWGDAPSRWGEEDVGWFGLLLGRVGERLADAGAAGLLFYPVRLLTSVFSPLLGLAGLWVLVRGRGALKPLARLGGGTLGVHALFLLFVLPVWDDRFLLPLAPLFAVGLGLAWTRVGEARTGAVLLGLGALVAADFHLGPPGPHNAEVVLLDSDSEHLPRTFAAGVLAASSEERRGWSRGDEDRSTRAAFREALWASILRCGGEAPAVLAERALVDGDGDHVWFQVRALEEQLLRGGRRVDPQAICIPDAAPNPEADRIDLLVTSRSLGLALPACANPEAWQAAGGVEDPEGGVGAVLWRPRGEPPCPPE